ncbi:hypothetical protein B0A49_02186 [Cryomyces minteri]|uniref:Glycerol uptake protein 1 n=1 Tax=Cryomyces minteri TaxID=331657 RepID=A0A4V5NGI1_9PEZI|nr:hypothetical protein B0A49_02186 [Cryomyces minteri]
MLWLHYLRRLYSLDTLDTRFTTSSRTPPAPIDPARAPSGEVGQTVSRQNGRSPVSGAQPSKWATPEFYFYYLIFLVCVPLMFKAVYDVSKESHPEYPKFAPLLSDGWIPGRRVDNSDDQYASFRDNIPFMFLLLLLHPLLRRAYNYVYSSATSSGVRPSTGANGGVSQSLVADARLEQRVSFDVGFAVIFLFALHGLSAFKVLSILYINFKLATRLPKAYVPAASWIFNIGILFANELCHGYPFAGVAAFFLPTSTSAASEKGSLSANWGSWLDSHGGLVPRWEILFNITVLRLISFNLDYYWSLNARDSSSNEKKQLDPSALSERDRVSIPAKPAEYSLRNYLAYALYSPLYLAGPILTFNDYISQQRYASPSVTTTRTTLYALRFLLSLLAMELTLHYIYAVAISKAQPTWAVYTPFQLSMLAYFNLHIIWLKLLLPWRFFRLWALVDGVDPPENMVRCMSDNYSALAFWRGWHRSFNRWIVRYIYVPLGGSGGANSAGSHDTPTGWLGRLRAVANFLAVFTFVALWHDINLRLLLWGWLVTLFVIPEIVASLLFPRRAWAARPTAYRVLCGVGAVANILMMMAANLVGFAVGLDGLNGLVKGIVGGWAGWLFLAAAGAALFVGVQVMFEIREGEARKGIKLKC